MMISRVHEWLVAAAFIMFGLGSWIMANSIFTEVPALYRQTPEGAAISAYILVALQSANIFPTLYMVFNRDEKYISIHNMIWILLVAGVIVCVLLSLFWDVQTYAFGELHSTVFFVLVFFGGFVSNTTSVVFYPFVSSFPPTYTSALAFGEGMSGLIAGSLAILQDSGAEKLHFSISSYFLCGGAVFVVAILGYAFLRYHPIAHQVKKSKYYESPAPIEYEEHEFSEKIPLVNSIKSPRVHKGFQIVKRFNAWKDFRTPLLVQFWICTLSFGVVPSLMPFFCENFKNSSEVLKWSSVLSMVFDPLGRLSTWVCRWYRVKALNFLVTLVAVVIILETTLSHALFSDYEYGGVFPVMCNCLFTFTFSYTQTMIYLTLKRGTHHKDSCTQVAYQWSGFVTQLGGFTGTLVTFPIVCWLKR